MSQARQEVKLLNSSLNALSLIYAAFRQCYSPGFVGDMWPRLLRGEVSLEKQAALITDVLASGHTSPVEHVSYTFAIQGVSRSLTHQLVRHRIASYSQQSQRYVDESGFEYILPPAIERIPQAREKFVRFMDLIQEAYQDLQQTLKSNGRTREEANEDARFILPNAAESKIVATMNCRSLLNFFELRCCERAQWEIRELAWKMLELVREDLPVIFASAGPKCERLGYCPEGEKFTCGKYPLKD